MTTSACGKPLHNVWAEREGRPSNKYVPPPISWQQRFEQLATDYGLDARKFDTAVALAARQWTSAITATPK